jgi:hypothetical protein
MEEITIEPLEKSRSSSNASPKTRSAMRKMQLEHDIELENRKMDLTWRTSCIELDRRCVIFITQTFFSLIVISFCIAKLVGPKEDDDTIYISLLTTILGIYLPSPSLASKK